MRHLEYEVFTLKDLRYWLEQHKDLSETMTVWVAPEWGEEAKPLRHIYCERNMQINHYGSKEDALILDSTPKKEVPEIGTGKVTREEQV
jgi:hypothetical protein